MLSITNELNKLSLEKESDDCQIETKHEKNDQIPAIEELGCPPSSNGDFRDTSSCNSEKLDLNRIQGLVKINEIYQNILDSFAKRGYCVSPVGVPFFPLEIPILESEYGKPGMSQHLLPSVGQLLNSGGAGGFNHAVYPRLNSPSSLDPGSFDPIGSELSSQMSCLNITPYLFDPVANSGKNFPKSKRHTTHLSIRRNNRSGMIVKQRQPNLKNIIEEAQKFLYMRKVQTYQSILKLEHRKSENLNLIRELSIKAKEVKQSNQPQEPSLD